MAEVGEDPPGEPLEVGYRGEVDTSRGPKFETPSLCLLPVLPSRQKDVLL